MEGKSEWFDAYRRAVAGVRHRAESALGEAGFELEEAIPTEREEIWRFRVRIRESPPQARDRTGAGEYGPLRERAGVPGRDPDLGEPAVSRAPERSRDPTRTARAVARLPGDALGDLLQRTDTSLAVGSGRGTGLYVPPLDPEVHIELLGATLVGDAFLDLRHRGIPPAGEQAARELSRAFAVFRDQCEAADLPLPRDAFLSALDAWAPGGFPSRADFLEQTG